MKLWSGTLSPFSAKVRIALAEKGIDYELLDTSKPLDDALFRYLSNRERLSRVR